MNDILLKHFYKIPLKMAELQLEMMTEINLSHRINFVSTIIISIANAFQTR